MATNEDAEQLQKFLENLTSILGYVILCSTSKLGKETLSRERKCRVVAKKVRAMQRKGMIKIMNREEILEKSRKENGEMDEREKEVMEKAGYTASAIGGLVCISIACLNAILYDGDNISSYSVWTVYLCMTGVLFIYKYVKLNKVHELILGIVDILLAVIFFVLYLNKLLMIR